LSTLVAGLAPHYPEQSARLPELERALSRAPAISVTTALTRDIPLAWVHRPPPGCSYPNLLWPGGSSYDHSRYVRRGAFEALHLADNPTTAGAEAAGDEPSVAPILPVPQEARAILRVDVDVPQVLDLADRRVRARLRVRRSELTQLRDNADRDSTGRPRAYGLTQAIGEMAYHLGFAGVLYPSARAARGRNLVVFTDRLARVGGQLSADDGNGTVYTLP
jgi:hypothetical protein